MKIKKKKLSNEPGRSNFRVGRGRSRQKICQKFLRSREKEKRDNFPRSFKLSSSFATRWSLLYIMKIVVESDSFLYEPCSTLGKLELTCYFSCKDIGAFSPSFSSFRHFLRIIEGEKEIFPNEFAICVFILDRIFSIVAHDRFDFTGR